MTKNREQVGARPLISPDLSVWLSSDFDQFLETCRAVGRHSPAPAFHPDYGALTSDEAFCLYAADSEGTVVHTQAVRLIENDLGSIGDYFKRNSGLFMPMDDRIDPCKTWVGEAAGFDLVGTTFCYHGELWIDPALRKRGLCPALTRFAIAKAIEIFEPDNVLMIAVPAVMNRKFVKVIGYEDFAPGCIAWRSRAGTVIEKEGIGWIQAAAKSPVITEEAVLTAEEADLRSVA